MHCIEKAVLFEYNAQHDCRQAGCIASGTRAVVQERVESQVMETFIEHKPLDSFVINTHAFHNAHLIRSILPRDLTAPIPYAADRRSHHDQIAQKLRVGQDSKRKVTALKAAQKKAARQNPTAQAAGTETPQLEETIAEGRRKRRRDETDLDAEENAMEIDD